ncbi:hypothetical protein MtrunA17_Chr8g0350151 [Medicago truncatula]|nr:hypothetical protein MtrunA17_Chr8g0350151 [Medicago truncatula]
MKESWNRNVQILDNEPIDDDNSEFSFSSVVNCRGFPRRLTAPGFTKLRQLTANGHLSNLIVFLN